MKKLSVLVSICIVTALLLISVVSCSTGTAPTAPTTAAPGATPVQQQATILRFAVPWPPGDPVTNNIEAFVSDFNARAGGKYVIELHPAEQLVKVAESMDALRTGAVEMAGWPTGVFASVDPRFAAAEVPFLANSVEADAAMQVKTLPLYSKVLEEKFNAKGIYSFTCLGLDLISTKPVKTAADWQGLMVQSVSPQSANFITSMGGSEVPMPFPDGYQGIQKGVVNASTQSSSMIIMFKMNEVAKYITRGYLIPASLIMAINLNTYNKMPQDIKDLLADAGLKAQQSTNEFFIKVDKENNDTLQGLGMEVYQLPKAERDLWVQKLQPYVDSLYEKMGPDFSAQLKQIAEEANAQNAYQEAP